MIWYDDESPISCIIMMHGLIATGHKASRRVTSDRQSKPLCCSGHVEA